MAELVNIRSVFLQTTVFVRSLEVDYLDTKLRSFAVILALIEKASSTLGTLNFIWATAVLLGGFSQSLKSIDFWFVSIILVVEGLRILCRRSELAIRPSLSSVFSLSNFSLSNSILSVIHGYSLVIQEYSAIACIVLSSLRIHKQQYGSDPNLNRNRALNLFYCLSVVESSMTLFGFVLRMVLSYPSISFLGLSENILSVVVGESYYLALKNHGFDDSQLSLFLRYLYDTYCRCMNGSVFDGLKMDFVSYSVELLQSIDDNDQLTGARLLSMLLKSDRLPSEKLRVIGTTPGVLNMLIEMLNWEKPQEQKIREVAGEIICKLVEIPRNRIRVMVLPESMESITSFLYDRNKIGIHSTKYQGQCSSHKYEYKYSDFSVLGLRILKILANDPDNCAKIGTNKGLLCKIIELNPEASESEIVRHLKITPIEKLESLARQQHDCDNIEAERSNDPNL